MLLLRYILRYPIMNIAFDLHVPSTTYTCTNVPLQRFVNHSAHWGIQASAVALSNANNLASSYMYMYMYVHV